MSPTSRVEICEIVEKQVCEANNHDNGNDDRNAQFDCLYKLFFPRALFFLHVVEIGFIETLVGCNFLVSTDGTIFVSLACHDDFSSRVFSMRCCGKLFDRADYDDRVFLLRLFGMKIVLFALGIYCVSVFDLECHNSQQ